MSRPKLEVNEVWILEEVLPYEGGDILAVYFDPEVAKKNRAADERGHGRMPWRRLPNGDWTTAPERKQAKDPFLLLTKHTIRTK